MNIPTLRVVTATRKSRADFFTQTALGKCLRYYNYSFVELDLYAENTEGLPRCYNQSIEKSKNSPAILVFAHDDIYLTDFYWPDRLIQSIKRFDVVGVAGNKSRVPNQPSWAFIDDQLTRDKRENLSGVVGHGKEFPPKNFSKFGPPYQEVKLLDGLILVCASTTLQQKNLQFDERFDFHFYDLDFCRQAETLGLRMGTWGLSVVHESHGNFKSPAWAQAKTKYFEKWGE